MKKSFVRKTVMLLTVHISILLFVLIAYILNSYQNAVDGVEQSAVILLGYMAMNLTQYLGWFHQQLFHTQHSFHVDLLTLIQRLITL